MIVFFFLLLFLSAILSASETAFTAITKLKSRSLVSQKIKGSERLHKLLENKRHLITGILIANTLVNIGATALATTFLVDLLTRCGLNNLAIIMFIVTAIITLLMLIFGEITPKVLAILYAEQFALVLTLPIYGFIWIFTPIIFCFEIMTNIIYKIFGISKHHKNIHQMTEEELKIMVTIGEESGVIGTRKKRMIHSIFDFSKTIVREIMTPRTDADCLEINTPMTDVLHKFIEKAHTRIPVYEEKIDNIVGIVHAKDLLSISLESETVSLKNFVREAIFIPETQNIEKLLHQMRKNKFHMAIVMDEHGGVSGIVTMEDIIEEIVGEIQDEYDETIPEIIQLEPHHYLIDGKTNISDLPDELLDEFSENDDYDTIGGFVLYILGKFPKKEEQIHYKNWLITVKEISKRRILKVEINYEKNT